MSNFEQEIRNKQFKQATGSAPNFRAIDGVGDKTARAVRNVIGIDAPSDAADKTADELAEEAGISESRARKVIRGGGGDPDRTPRSNTGTVSAAGIRVPTGEFKPEIGDKDTAEARFDSSIRKGIGRSQNAAIADKAKRAPVTTDVERWKENKGELDFPGVDTPTDDPQVLPKDLRQEQRPATTEPDDPPEETSRTIDRGNVFQNTTKTEGVARGVDITPNRGLEPRETEGVTGLSGKERDEFGGAGFTSAGGARRGNVPQGFVDNLASGRNADLAFTEAEQDRGEPADPFDVSDGGGVLDTSGSGETPAGVARRESERQAAQSDRDTAGLRSLDSRIRAARGDELDTSDAKYGAEEKEQLASLFK